VLAWIANADIVFFLYWVEPFFLLLAVAWDASPAGLNTDTSIRPEQGERLAQNVFFHLPQCHHPTAENLSVPAQRLSVADIVTPMGCHVSHRIHCIHDGDAGLLARFDQAVSA
jgi:hypothetical protein